MIFVVHNVFILLFGRGNGAGRLSVDYGSHKGDFYGVIVWLHHSRRGVAFLGLDNGQQYVITGNFGGVKNSFAFCYRPFCGRFSF